MKVTKDNQLANMRVTPFPESKTTTIEVELDNLEYGFDRVPAFLQCDVEVIDDTHFVAATVKEGSWFIQRRDGDYTEWPYECGSHDKELERTAIEMFKKAQAK